MKKIIEILQLVRQSETEKVSDGERQLKELRDSDFSGLIKQLSIILSDESIEFHTRQLTCIVLKNFLQNDNKATMQWMCIPNEERKLIKNNILSCLASPIGEVRRSSGNLVSIVARIELSHNEWNEIYDVLVSTSMNTDKYIRISSIYTIGEIAANFDQNMFSESVEKSLLGAIIMNMDKNLDEEIIVNALKSFNNFVSLISINLARNEEKNYIFHVLNELLEMKNIEIKKLVFQCFIEICRFHYNLIEDKIDYFGQISKIYIYDQDQKLSIDCLEIWCSISEEDFNQKIQKSKKAFFYCDQIFPTLLTFIEYHLFNRNKQLEKEDPDAWYPYNSALVILKNLSRFSKHDLVNKIFDLIGKYLSDEDYKKRESVICAFGTILNPKHKSKISAILEGAILTLLNLLDNDPSSEVRFTISWCFKKICQNISDSLFELPLSVGDNFIQGILNFLNLENQKINKKIIFEVCESFSFLIENERNNYQNFQTSILSKYYGTLLEKLLQISVKFSQRESSNSQNTYNLSYSSFNTLISLIKNSPSDCLEIIELFFPNIIEALNLTFDIKVYLNEESRTEQQENVCNLIATVVAYGKIKLNFEKAQYLYDQVKKIFLQKGNVFQGGIFLCSSLAISMGSNFKESLIDFLNYLNVGLNSIDNTELCRVSINCLSDLIRSLAYDLESYIHEFYARLFEIVHNPNADKSLKSNCFIVFSDMFYYIPKISCKYSMQIIEMLYNAITATYYNLNDDPDMIEYQQNLKKRILETFFYFFASYFNVNNKGIYDYISIDGMIINIKNFIENSLDANDNRFNYEFYSMSFDLLIDISKYAKNEFMNRINYAFINKLAKRLNLSEDERHKNVANRGLIYLENYIYNDF